MNAKELYLYLKNKRDYITAGIDVQYKVEVHDDEKKVYLCFEESASKQDWKINFDFPIKVYKQQKNKFLVHRGYVKAYKSCNDQIMNEFISKIKETGYMPFICGWSYGGAMSVLASEDFYFRTGLKPEVTTFGAPKILYFNFTRKYFKSCCNIVNQYAIRNDFVPRYIPFFFVHHLNRIPLGERFCLIKSIKQTGYLHCHYEEYL